MDTAAEWNLLTTHLHKVRKFDKHIRLQARVRWKVEGDLLT